MLPSGATGHRDMVIRVCLMKLFVFYVILLLQGSSNCSIDLCTNFVNSERTQFFTGITLFLNHKARNIILFIDRFIQPYMLSSVHIKLRKEKLQYVYCICFQKGCHDKAELQDEPYTYHYQDVQKFCQFFFLYFGARTCCLHHSLVHRL